jgi:hypothetical protein
MPYSVCFLWESDSVRLRLLCSPTASSHPMLSGEPNPKAKPMGGLGACAEEDGARAIST